MKIVDVREGSELAKLLKTDSKVILDFYADWCNPCKVLTRTIEEIRKTNLFPEVTIAKINVDKFPEVAQNYKVRSMPTMLFTSDESGDRHILKTKVGLLNKESLEELIGSIYE